MATQQEGSALPDFLRMDGSGEPPAAAAVADGRWYGWPSKELKPVTLSDEQGRTVRVRAPVMDLEGLITPTELHYVVQHFDVPEVISSDQWTLSIDGEIKLDGLYERDRVWAQLNGGGERLRLRTNHGNIDIDVR